MNGFYSMAIVLINVTLLLVSNQHRTIISAEMNTQPLTRCESLCQNDDSCRSGDCVLTFCSDTESCYKYCFTCHGKEKCFDSGGLCRYLFAASSSDVAVVSSSTTQWPSTKPGSLMTNALRYINNKLYQNNYYNGQQELMFNRKNMQQNNLNSWLFNNRQPARKPFISPSLRQPNNGTSSLIGTTAGSGLFMGVIKFLSPILFFVKIIIGIFFPFSFF